MYLESEIIKLTNPTERLYQRSINATFNQAKIDAAQVISGGGSTVRTSFFRVTANGPDVLAPVVVEDSSEQAVIKHLKSAWPKARRARDLDIFKREVVQRSGGAVSRELAEQWAETLLRTQPYTAYKVAKASYLSEAVAKHPANHK